MRSFCLPAAEWKPTGHLWIRGVVPFWFRTVTQRLETYGQEQERRLLEHDLKALFAPLGKVSHSGLTDSVLNMCHSSKKLPCMCTYWPLSAASAHQCTYETAHSVLSSGHTGLQVVVLSVLDMTSRKLSRCGEACDVLAVSCKISQECALVLQRQSETASFQQWAY